MTENTIGDIVISKSIVMDKRNRPILIIKDFIANMIIAIPISSKYQKTSEYVIKINLKEDASTMKNGKRLLGKKLPKNICYAIVKQYDEIHIGNLRKPSYHLKKEKFNEIKKSFDKIYKKN